MTLILVGHAHTNTYHAYIAHFFIYDPADNSSVEELPCRLLDPPLATMLSAGTLLEPPPWEL